MFEFLAAPKAVSSSKLAVVDLFCGTGGFSQGATDAGHDVVLAVDNWDLALEWHKANHPNATTINLDLPCDASLLPLPGRGERPWHLHGSPPCADLSAAHTSKTAVQVGCALDRVRWFLKLALHCTATSWSFEQVAVESVRSLCEEFRAKLPTKFAYEVVHCNHYGIPQLRKRLIAGPPCLIHRLRQRKRPASEARVAAWITPPPAPCVRFPKRHRRDRGEAERRELLDEAAETLSVEQAGYTITASHAQYWCTADGRDVQRMTPAEAAALQTFPRCFKLPPVNRDAQALIGNAVPPKLAQLLLCDNDRYSKLFGSGQKPPLANASPSCTEPQRQEWC